MWHTPPPEATNAEAHTFMFHGIMAALPLPEPAAAHYGRLTSGMPVRVACVPGKNKALLATAPAAPGSVLFFEAPLGSLQHDTNRGLVRACDHCQAFVGSLDRKSVV